LGLGGWMYVAVTTFIALAAFNSQTNLLFWTFGLMSGALIVSWYVGRAMFSRLTVTRLVPDHGAVDEPMLIRYQIHNRKWLMPCFGRTVHGAMRGKPHGWVLHVGARSQVQAEAVGWPLRRGPVEFHRVQLSTTFPFGIMTWTLTIHLPGRVIVYPKIYRIRRELLWDIRSRDLAGSRVSHVGGGTEEFFGLREYRPGDAMKQIDWKHSVRMNALVSRDMTRLSPPKLMVLLDLRDTGRWPYDPGERAISFAASVLCEAHLDGFDVGLSVLGVSLPTFATHHSRWHRTRMLHALGEIDLTGERGSIATVPPQAQDANWLVIHSGGMDRSVMAAVGGQAVAHLDHTELERWRVDANVLNLEDVDEAEKQDSVMRGAMAVLRDEL